MHVGVFLDDKKAMEGGGFTFIHDIVAAFLESAGSCGHRFTLFCPPGFEKSIAGKLPANVQAQALAPRSALERMAMELRHASAMFAIAWRKPCRLERLARGVGVEMMWFVGGAYDTLDMPYFTTVWDLQHRTHPWFPEVSAAGVWDHREAFFKRHLGRAARIITGTQVGKAELSRFYEIAEDQVCILPHSTPRFALDAAGMPPPAPPRGLAPGYFFYPAQCWPHKNHANLLRGYRLLCDRIGDPPPLVFSGSSKNNEAFVKSLTADLKLEKRVHMLGFVSVEEIVALYRNALALVYASFSGPENLPPLEAFALGCPVVASDFPGAREQLEDAALFFDPRDPESIAQSLDRAITDVAGRTSRAQKGRARARRWTSAEFVRGIYREIDAFAAERGSWGA